MNDRVVASLRSGAAQLELMALAWRRTSLSVLANGVPVLIATRPPKPLTT
jgi:uncharacterized membrane protein YidH (DUF202 family)